MASRLATKSDSDGNDAAKPLMVKSVPTCLTSVSHSRSGRLLLISSMHVHGRRLAATQLLDERDALGELGFARLELLHLRQNRAQLNCLRFGFGDVPIDLRRPLAKREEPPADAEDGRDENQARAERDAVRRGNDNPALLLRSGAFDGKEVDPNHRSPALRSARPTATAAVGAASRALDAEFRGVEGHPLEGIEELDRRLKPLRQHLGEALRASTHRHSRRCE